MRKYNKISGSVRNYKDENGNSYNFYIYITVNGRDVIKGYFLFQSQVSKWLKEKLGGHENNNFKKVDGYWISSLMKPESRIGRGKFLYDIDTKDLKDSFWHYLNSVSPVILRQETKNGWHVVVDAFDRRKMEDVYKRDVDDFYEIKTDALLFVERIINGE